MAHSAQADYRLSPLLPSLKVVWENIDSNPEAEDGVVLRTPGSSSLLHIEKIDHIGIRVMDVEKALAFYAILGFGEAHRVTHDAVTIIKNPQGVEINLITNGMNDNGGKNVLMDMPDKYPGYTHVALRVGSIVETIKVMEIHEIAITGGPVDFGDGSLSIFVRDPDGNVIELRGRNNEKLAPQQYGPQ